ncbi:USP domain-containing protein [Entamoeba marina]
MNSLHKHQSCQFDIVHILKNDLFLTLTEDLQILNPILNNSHYQHIMSKEQNGCITSIKTLKECEALSIRLGKVEHVPTPQSKTARKKKLSMKNKQDLIFVGGGVYWKCLQHPNDDIRAFGIKKILSFLDTCGKNALTSWLLYFVERSIQEINTFEQSLALLIFFPDYLVLPDRPQDYPKLTVRDVSYDPYTQITVLPYQQSLPLLPNTTLLPFYNAPEANYHQLTSSPIDITFPQEFYDALHNTSSIFALQLLLNLNYPSFESTQHLLLKALSTNESLSLKDLPTNQQLFLLPQKQLDSLPEHPITHFSEAYLTFCFILNQPLTLIPTLLTTLLILPPTTLIHSIVSSLPSTLLPQVSISYIEAIPHHPITSTFFSTAVNHLLTLPTTYRLKPDSPEICHVLSTFPKVPREEAIAIVDIVLDFLDVTLKLLPNVDSSVHSSISFGAISFIRMLFEFDTTTPPMASKFQHRIRILSTLHQMFQLSKEALEACIIKFRECLSPFELTPYNSVLCNRDNAQTPGVLSKSTSGDLNDSLHFSSYSNSLSASFTPLTPSKSRRRGKNSAAITTQIGNVIGLRNLGSTCYMNSILQQLYADVFFRNSLLLLPAEQTTKPFTAYIKQIFAKMFISSIPVDPRVELSGMNNSKYHKIKFSLQRDALEALMELFDAIENEVSPELLLNSFTVTTKTEICSSECEHVQRREEQHVVIPLEIKGSNNLLESLEFFTGVEFIGERQYRCEECQQYINIKKQTMLDKLPNTVIFQLKRFDYDLFADKLVKINSYFTFPEYLNLRPFTSSPNDQEFTLVGVIVHIGSAVTGHYISYVKDGLKWYLCNDEEVVEVRKEKAEAEWFGSKNKSGYILFYRRILPLNPTPMIKVRMVDEKQKKKQKKVSFHYEVLNESSASLNKSLLSNSSSNPLITSSSSSMSMTSSNSSLPQSLPPPINSPSPPPPSFISLIPDEFLFTDDAFYTVLQELTLSLTSLTTSTDVSFYIQLLFFTINERCESPLSEHQQLLDNLLAPPTQLIADGILQLEVLHNLTITKKYLFNPKPLSQRYATYLARCIAVASTTHLNDYATLLLQFFISLRLSRRYVRALRSLFPSSSTLFSSLHNRCIMPSEKLLKEFFQSCKTHSTEFISIDTDLSPYYNFLYSTYQYFECDVRNVVWLVDFTLVFRNRAHIEKQKTLDYVVIGDFIKTVCKYIKNVELLARVFLKIYSFLEINYFDDVVESPAYTLLTDLLDTFELQEIRYILNMLESKDDSSIQNHVLYTLLRDVCYNLFVSKTS